MESFTLVTGLVILIGAVLILVVLNYFVPLGLWLTAYFSDVPVSLATMMGCVFARFHRVVSSTR